MKKRISILFMVLVLIAMSFNFAYAVPGNPDHAKIHGLVLSRGTTVILYYGVDDTETTVVNSEGNWSQLEVKTIDLNKGNVIKVNDTEYTLSKHGNGNMNGAGQNEFWSTEVKQTPTTPEEPVIPETPKDPITPEEVKPEEPKPSVESMVYVYVKVTGDTEGLVLNNHGWYTIGKVSVKDLEDAATAQKANYQNSGDDYNKVINTLGSIVRFEKNQSIDMNDITFTTYGLKCVSDGADNYVDNGWTWHLDGTIDISDVPEELLPEPVVPEDPKEEPTEPEEPTNPTEPTEPTTPEEPVVPANPTEEPTTPTTPTDTPTTPEPEVPTVPETSEDTTPAVPEIATPDVPYVPPVVIEVIPDNEEEIEEPAEEPEESKKEPEESIIEEEGTPLSGGESSEEEDVYYSAKKPEATATDIANEDVPLSDVPKTGDEQNLLLYIVLVIGSLFGLKKVYNNVNNH